MTRIKFREWECELRRARYMDGQWPCIVADDAETGERIANCTVNLPDRPGKGEVAIKDYSENEGMLAALMEAGVVSSPHRYVPSGLVMIPICTLNEEVL